jgi:hypothetical protein
LFELKVNKPRKLKMHALLRVTSVTPKNLHLQEVTATIEDSGTRSIVVYKGPAVVDWSRIADMIAAGYTSGHDMPPNTNWELISSE